jgi:hypothetical protein
MAKPEVPLSPFAAFATLAQLHAKPQPPRDTQGMGVITLPNSSDMGGGGRHVSSSAKPPAGEIPQTGEHFLIIRVGRDASIRQHPSKTAAKTL